MKNKSDSMKEINLLFTKECKKRGIVKKAVIKNFMIDFINENYVEKTIKVNNSSQKETFDDELETKENNSEEKPLSFKERKKKFDDGVVDTLKLSNEAKEKLLGKS